VVVGADGINLNAGETTGDVDVVVTGAPTIILDGQAGGDILSVGGGAGTGGSGPIATVIGGAGDDRLVAGTAGSTFDGGDGSDTISYSAIGGSVSVDLAAGTGTTGAGEDVLVSIENAIGSAGDDVLLGDGGPNALDGGAGADRISGAAGDDTLDGDAGVDLLDASDASAVIVDLEAGVLTGQGTDALDGFENVRGSDGADRIDGNGAQNSLDGAGGADRIDGAGGADELKGGSGIDTVTYGSSSRGVTVSLAEGTATGAGADTLTGFEDLIGSPDDDTLEGADGKNVIDGRSGADQIDGLDGQDRLIGGNGADQLFGGAANDLLLGGTRRDQLNGGVGTDDVCRGGEEPDSFVFCENYRTTVSGVWFVEIG
jgi:Ca2+-binding RTX toxin-like protein